MKDAVTKWRHAGFAMREAQRLGEAEAERELAEEEAAQLSPEERASPSGSKHNPTYLHPEIIIRPEPEKIK